MAIYCITYVEDDDWGMPGDRFKTRREVDLRLEELRALDRFARLIRWDKGVPIEVLRVNEHSVARGEDGAELWFELEQESGHFGPALYRLRLVNGQGEPIAVPTLLTVPDQSGIVDIGEAGSFEVRRLQMVTGVNQCYGHSAANLFRYLCQFTCLCEVFPGCRLQYPFRPAASKDEAMEWEAKAIKEYIIRRGQLPILNRELPGAYNDEEWNAVWERVFGRAPV